jgi:hypothetical protein
MREVLHQRQQGALIRVLHAEVPPRLPAGVRILRQQVPSQVLRPREGPSGRYKSNTCIYSMIIENSNATLVI